MSISIKNYFEPTPKNMKKLGDAILLGSSGLATIMMGAPFTESTITWVVWSLNVFGVLGKVITNFFKE